MIKTTCLFFVLATLVHCAPPGESSLASAKRDPDSDPKMGRPTKVCYYPSANNAYCHQTLAITDISDGKELYDYPSPFNNPQFPRGFDPKQYMAPDRLLNLRDIPPSALISPHFTRDELMPANSIRGNYGFFSPTVLSKIEAIRTQLGVPVTITSGYRSPGYNERLSGAADWSRHTYGDGIDFVAGSTSYIRLEQACKNQNAGFTLIYNDHIHCDWRSTALDSAFFPLEPGKATMRTDSQLLALAIAEQSTILVSTSALPSAEAQLILRTEVPQEDQGELIHDWRIILPSGEVVQSILASPSIPRLVGTYEINVLVGGSIALKRTIIIE